MRKKVTGDPDYSGQFFAREENLTTWILHPHDTRKQYREAKKKKGRAE